MKTRIFTLVIICMASGFHLGAQSTLSEVYDILQSKCASCHSNTNPEAGLDLEGAGATLEAKALDVRNNLVGVAPENSYASEKNYKYIYAGRPDLSYLFRKINQTFEPTIHFEEGDNAEGNTMPPVTEEQLSSYEKEMIRQWVLYGAPANGAVVNPQLIEDFYDGMGLESFPDGPPPAPAAEEGFQIKMGPFFLDPAGQGNYEVEYFQKYELDHILTEDLEVNRVDIKIGPSSHHFIIYDFDSPSIAQSVAPGFRLDPFHYGIGLVAAVQESTDLKLPEGTAFSWEDNLVLELNSHYINYSSTQILKAEAYANVYTQSSGTAAQEMRTELIVDDNIYIPNDGNLDTEVQVVNPNLGEVFVWGLMGHTHQWGRGYEVFTRENGQQADLIYDASCAGGIPGCISPYFDYQHIPIRYINPFLPITFNFNNGIIHKASYINTGPNPVSFGLTSDDEMMVLVMMYVTDTTGIVFEESPTSIEDFDDSFGEIKVFPNPVNDLLNIELPIGLSAADLTIYNTFGQVVHRVEDWDSSLLQVSCRDWSRGMYIYQVEDEYGRVSSGKFMVEY